MGKRTENIPFILLLAATVGALVSCNKKSERPRWETEIVAPLVNTSLSINDFIPDSSISNNEDNILSLVYKEPLYSFGLDSLVGLKVEPFKRNKSVEALSLGPDTVEYQITLGMVAREMQENGDPTGDMIMNNHGSMFPVFAETEGLSLNPMYFDISGFIQSARIKSGSMKMVIENGFPLSINDVNIKVANYPSMDPLFEEVIPAIESGSNYESGSVDLSGKSVEGALQIDVSNFGLGTGLVRIDTNDAITTKFIVDKLTVEEATAVFPAQDLVDEEQNTALEDMGEVKLTKANLKSGKIRMEASTTAQDTIYFSYSIPVATNNGQPFLVTGYVPPATPGAPASKTFEYDFAGYQLDLTGKNKDTINCIYNHLTARIEETGEPVHISLDDYIDITLNFEDIQPSYIEGYLGEDTIDLGPGEVELDFFDDLQADRLDFNDIKLSLEVENGLGATGELEVDYLTASNGDNSVTMNDPVNGTVPAALSSPLRPQSKVLTVSKTNVSPVELLNIRPDKVAYAGKVYLNKGRNSSDLSGFAYEESQLKASLNLELPLNLVAENLTLSDTIDFAGATLNESVTEGKLSILAWNGYPLDASIKVAFYDQNMELIDSMTTGKEIKAAALSANTERVEEKEYSKITFNHDAERLRKMLKAEKVVFTVNFWTAPSNEFIKIYSDYLIDLKLAGDFNYTVLTK